MTPHFIGFPCFVWLFSRTKANPAFDFPPTDSTVVTPGSREYRVTGSPEAAWAQVIVRTRYSPDALIESVSLRAAPRGSY